jgi:hypothetical protein
MSDRITTGAQLAELTVDEIEEARQADRIDFGAIAGERNAADDETRRRTNDARARIRAGADPAAIRAELDQPPPAA